MPDDLPQQLLRLAREDEVAARTLLPAEEVADATVGFHCQQAVEKALKAALALRELKFPHTHDLGGLTELCREGGLEIPTELDGVDRLGPYGVQMRYDSTYTPALDRPQALRWAQVAIEWVTGLERTRDAQDPWRSRSPHDRADRADR